MIDFMDEIYYMMIERISRECMQRKEARVLAIQKYALTEEIGLLLGDRGEELLDKLSDLSAELEALQDKELFRASLQLGAEIASPGAGR